MWDYRRGSYPFLSLQFGETVQILEENGGKYCYGYVVHTTFFKTTVHLMSICSCKHTGGYVALKLGQLSSLSFVNLLGWYRGFCITNKQKKVELKLLFHMFGCISNTVIPYFCCRVYFQPPMST